MDKTKLGSSDLYVSSVCLGTDSFGSRISELQSYRILDRYVELSGNVIDTANIYAAFFAGFHGGESEATIGRWLKDRRIRNQLVLCSKLGQRYPGFGHGLSANIIEQECEKSLRRLQVDYLDLYYAHVDDHATPIEETMGAFHRLIKAGKVRAIGASNLWIWRIAQANLLAQLRGWTTYCTIQQRYSYLRPRHGADFKHQVAMNEDVKRYAKDTGVSLMAYSVLLQGAYTRADRVLPAEYSGEDARARLAVLRAVAEESGTTANQVLIAWLRQSTPPVIPIIAASEISQLEEDLFALTIELTDDQMQRLESAGNPGTESAAAIPEPSCLRKNVDLPPESSARPLTV